MSGPDDRRGPDGGEHPLDVDARFADIVSHFHDDEPARPRVVDGSVQDPQPGRSSTSVPADTAPDAPDEPDEQPDPVGGVSDASAVRTGDHAPDPSAGRPEASPEERADALIDRVAAELRAERQAHEARVAAEVDRAVDGGDAGRFVPEDPPPLPRPDLPGRLAWTAVLAGPVLLLLCALLWRSAPSWVLGAIVTAVVAGFGFLVWRLPRTGERDGHDDGAVV